ncbi:hypothetical protein H920_15595 [Fukomys damarensis]|uniref:Uncharacterized protein n=1 Tax=Fukomys damarensis TaxID=885580 RepID=A0A091CWI5_FUKDA|nr:hypothetical protein H920_15595 [Fukomys damarensis]
MNSVSLHVTEGHRVTSQALYTIYKWEWRPPVYTDSRRKMHLRIHGLPEIFREKCIYDRIHRGIAVGQAVGSDPEEEGSRGQREGPKFSPEMDNVVWQPRYPEYHNHHQDRLRCLEEEGKRGRKKGRGEEEEKEMHGLQQQKNRAC